MATILTFSTQNHLRRALAHADTRAEVVVFPRTDIRALRRLSENRAGSAACGDRLATPTGDDSPA